ncbi:ATP-binding protein [Aquisediminimonas sediminicola]|uniref:ATP-binding protein n=1 Tax=Alteraquisediminimonas sediminicola TaxID=2676787 RepID=UPI001C8DA853|nr:ATP-binding protein [Aquisediminimonas sediminicola]
MDSQGTPFATDDHIAPIGFAPQPPENSALLTLGHIYEVSGASAQAVLDSAMVHQLSEHQDPCIAMAGQIGGFVKIKVANAWLVANIRTLAMFGSDGDRIIAAIDFMGEGDYDARTRSLVNFRRGITRYPSPGLPINPLDNHELQQIFATDGRPHFEIGTVYPTKDIRGAVYLDGLLNRHFALLGSTGTGKSTAAALILHKICALAPNGHIVVVDPHGEYSAAFKSVGALFDVNNLALPYWMMNFEEHCEVFVTSEGSDRQRDSDLLAKCLLAARAKNRIGAEIPRLTVDSPVPYLLSDLTNIIQGEMGKMDRAGDSSPYMRLKNKIDEIKADPRYNFMFSGMLVSDTMADFIAKIFRMPGDGRPISIIDVSGVPSNITSTVVAVISRLVFDYAVWARNEPQRPIMFVCEEAHRYIPSDRITSHSAVRRILERIAKEGRKYGVSLGLITQRPSDLAEGVLSQCGTIITMRLNNERDQAMVRAAMPEGARGFLDSIPALLNRECIICGEGVAIPIRVGLDNLEAEKRPASSDPVFSTLWREKGGEKDVLNRVVDRWRHQGR